MVLLFVSHFFGKIDEDGEIVDEAGEMRYYGMGVIGYNRNALRLKTNEELLFHEFSTFFRQGDLKPQKSRNNELEAYLAQYIYVRKPNKRLLLIPNSP